MLRLDRLVEVEGLDENSCVGFWNKDRAFQVCSIVILTLSTGGVVVQGLTCVRRLSDLEVWVLKAMRCALGFYELVQICDWFSLGMELGKYGVLEKFF
jgi:hypothetical protein